MDAQHTPGPWCVVTGKNIFVAPVRLTGGTAKAVAVCNYDNGPIEKANAALIAAAPKLLDIAQRLGVYLPAELQPEVNAVIAEALGHDG